MPKASLIFIIIILLATACSTLPKDVVPTNTEPSAPITGDAKQGEFLFKNGAGEAPPCTNCHKAQTGTMNTFAIGPNLTGIGDRAGGRVEGLTAEGYIQQSILHPGDHVVAGYRNLMYKEYSEKYTPQEIADLVAYLMGL